MIRSRMAADRHPGDGGGDVPRRAFPGYWLMGHIPMTKRVRRMPRNSARRHHGVSDRADRREGRFRALSRSWWRSASMMVRRNEFLAVGLALVAATLARAAGL